METGSYCWGLIIPIFKYPFWYESNDVMFYFPFTYVYMIHGSMVLVCYEN